MGMPKAEPKSLAERYEGMRQDVEGMNAIMVRNGLCPFRVVKYQETDIYVYDLHGHNYIAARDLGLILGLANPDDSIRVLFNRHKLELEKHSARIEVIRHSADGGGAGTQKVRVFSEAGCNLITMFARTRKAAEARAWLANLPNWHRETLENLKEQLCLANERLKTSYENGLEQGLRLLEDLPTEIMSLEDLGQLIALRRLGFTQVEAANSLGVSREQVQYAEKLLKSRGLEFAPVRQGPRRKHFRALAARALCDAKQTPPSPPLLKGGDKDHRLEACATGGL